MLEFRLSAFEKWKKMQEPDWAFLAYKTGRGQVLFEASTTRFASIMMV
jgi:hypothetical protein